MASLRPETVKDILFSRLGPIVGRMALAAQTGKPSFAMVVSASGNSLRPEGPFTPVHQAGVRHLSLTETSLLRTVNERTAGDDSPVFLLTSHVVPPGGDFSAVRLPTPAETALLDRHPNAVGGTLVAVGGTALMLVYRRADEQELERIRAEHAPGSLGPLVETMMNQGFAAGTVNYQLLPRQGLTTATATSAMPASLYPQHSPATT